MGSPSGPSSSGSSGSGAPSPGGPATGGAPAVPVSSGARGGIALDFRRGKTAKKLLDVDWTYPVWKPANDNPKPGTTAAVEVEHALPIEQAYELVTDGDKRPLLVLRECEKCKGTDHALLSRSLDNEQTVMMTKWFRCVKLPTSVVEKNHPFTNLFLREKEGERVPHLFFADPDGSNRAELPGDQPQTKVWETMFSYLDRCYEGDAKQSIRELRKVLSQYDKIDVAEQEVKTRIEKEIEKNGASSKVKKLEADLARLGKERDEVKAKENALRALALKSLNASKTAEPAAAR